MKTNLQSANERIETIENELGNEISDLKEELNILKQQHSACQQRVSKRGGLPLTALFNGILELIGEFKHTIIIVQIKI